MVTDALTEYGSAVEMDTVNIACKRMANGKWDVSVDAIRVTKSGGVLRKRGRGLRYCVNHALDALGEPGETVRIRR